MKYKSLLFPTLTALFFTLFFDIIFSYAFDKTGSMLVLMSGVALCGMVVNLVGAIFIRLRLRIDLPNSLETMTRLVIYSFLGGLFNVACSYFIYAVMYAFINSGLVTYYLICSAANAAVLAAKLAAFYFIVRTAYKHHYQICIKLGGRALIPALAMAALYVAYSVTDVLLLNSQSGAQYLMLSQKLPTIIYILYVMTLAVFICFGSQKNGEDHFAPPVPEK
ncbi:MAG: hypothetical protein RSD39_01860 [Oscillospiraceae bacterium]